MDLYTILEKVGGQFRPPIEPRQFFLYPIMSMEFLQSIDDDETSSREFGYFIDAWRQVESIVCRNRSEDQK